ncbi:MAG: type IV pilus modification protein PilV [Rhodanobacter sp.]|nr:MAG: type IV pilus modification protein PilV [Rhodanobacter sp.]TAM38724.1 MAG: type IV pilus modification protein PilV [Rhodanobacter sp.]TAN23191.1 MAG: type IV pilus modification protein PilV [Rhodanobacter sp.]
MRSKSHQRGVSLIEVLMAVLIFSIGLIGLAGLLVVATRSNQVAYLRTQAIFLANNMAERMSANPTGVWTGDYNAAYPVAAATVGCDSAPGCNAAEVAVHDQQIWSRQLQTFLPHASASIACTGVASVTYNPIGKMPQRPPYGGNCAMSLHWIERGAGDQAHRDAATQTFGWNFQP